LVEKAAVLGVALGQGHPFVDGNKRVSHAAMATFLVLNGIDIDATVDEQERFMLDLASGRVTRSQLVDWLLQHVNPSLIRPSRQYDFRDEMRLTSGALRGLASSRPEPQVL
jgi:prophage maintenance system killer protein